MAIKITDLEIKQSILLATEIWEQYKLYVIGSDGFSRSTEELLDIFVQYLGKKVEARDLKPLPNETAEMYKALCVVYADGRYRIFLQSHLNRCWRRYTLCKEMFHVVLDKPEYRNINLREHIEKVLFQPPVQNASDDYPAGTAELMAEIAAMEFLFPFSERVKRMKEAEGQTGQTAPMFYYGLAKYYEVPQALVERYMSPMWIELLADCQGIKI